jgi:NADH-quinone oxidoreductase subunit J
MNAVFYSSAVVAVVSTALVITEANAVRALLYLIVSLLAVALVFFVLGAPFAAAVEVIVYAGAIVVLFVFVAMMLNLGPQSADREMRWMPWRSWIGPALLTLVLLVELIYVISGRSTEALAGAGVGPEAVGVALFGPYLLGVELASVLLLAGLVGAYHLGRRTSPAEQEPQEIPEIQGRQETQGIQGPLDHGQRAD